MIESINNLLMILLALLALAVIGFIISIGVSILGIIFWIFIYLISFMIALLGLFLFTKGGGIGTFGLILLIIGVYFSFIAYFKCERCGTGFKILWFGKSLGKTTHSHRLNYTNKYGVDYIKYRHSEVDCRIGTKCLKCGNTKCWSE